MLIYTRHVILSYPKIPTLRSGDFSIFAPLKLYNYDIIYHWNIAGRKLRALAAVTGSTIQSKNVFSDFGQSLKNIVGGELRSYTSMMEKARKIATDRMIAQAEAMGADAIIGVRYATSAIMAQAAEVLVYGTAIRFR